MSAKRGLSICVCVAMLVTGCVGLSGNQLTVTPEGTPIEVTQLSATVLATTTPVPSTPTAHVAEPTLTGTTPPATPSTTPTPTIPPEAMLKIECIDVAPDFGIGQSYPGTIILTDSSTGIFAIDASTNNPAPLVDTSDRFLDPVVSPDRRYLAFVRVEVDAQGLGAASELQVVDAHGIVRASLPWQRTRWINLAEWLDKERLVVAVIPPEPRLYRNVASLLVINPFTGQQQTVGTSPSDIYDIRPVPDWEGWGPQVYDPSLARVAYLQGIEGIYWAYALWDSISARTLVSLKTFNNRQRPVWSPDGQQFVVAGQSTDVRPGLKLELYAFDRAGVISKMTNLSAYFPATYIQSYSWSPDGRYIAFWLNNDYDPRQKRFGEQHLAILGTSTGEVTDYCVPGDYDTGLVQVVPAPIWSPDGQQLIVENRYAEQANRVILVDIAKGFAAQIAENMEPVGWMTSSP